jgi:type II secretory pathway component GspD/PulD (secretin)
MRPRLALLAAAAAALACDKPTPTTTPEPAPVADAPAAATTVDGLHLVPVKHAKAPDVARTLSELFGSQPGPFGLGGRPAPSLFQIAVDTRTNTVIFQAREPKRVLDLIEKLDQPAPQKP